MIFDHEPFDIFFTTEMVLKLALVEGHRRVVLGLYRALIRNALHAPIPKKDQVQLVTGVRRRFRARSALTNGMVVQRAVIEAAELNDLVVRAYSEGLFRDLALLINKKWYSKRAIIDGDSKASGENAVHETTTRSRHFQPDREPVLTPAPIFLKTQALRPYKTPHDKRYIKEILSSVIAHGHYKRYLADLAHKLNKPRSSAKLRKVSGTSVPIFMVNAPWNRDIRTESGLWFRHVRQVYDGAITDWNTLQAQKAQYTKWAEWENQWECEWDPKAKHRSTEYMWCFKESERVIRERINAMNVEVKQFNARQAVVFQKLKPLFEENHQKARANVSRLLKIAKQRGVGAYTDISQVYGRNLKHLLKDHHFGRRAKSETQSKR